MHDDLLERSLRSALHDEAGRLAFTITAAELERRAILRGRAPGAHRMTLLLAAAIGIGVLGVGGLIGGLFDETADPTPGPTSAVVGPSDPTPTEAAPTLLPGFDELIAIPGIGAVVVAQAHGPADAPEPWQGEVPEPPPSVTLDLPNVPGEVVIRLACIGATNGEISVDAQFPTPIAPSICDGTVDEVVLGMSPRSLTLSFTAPASWRVVVAQAADSPSLVPRCVPSCLPPILSVPADEEALVTVDQLTMQADFSEADPGGRVRIELEPVAARWWYRYSLWCVGGPDAQYIHGDEIDGMFVARTITQVPCDGAIHSGKLQFPEPNGSRVFLDATPETVVSLVVSSEVPPVAYYEQVGWQLTGGFGPSLNFDTHGSAYTGMGVEGGGTVLVALDCVGTKPVKVSVETNVPIGSQGFETFGSEFNADCAPDGAVTATSLALQGSTVHVEYTALAGSWTAMTILVPDPLPSPE